MEDRIKEATIKAAGGSFSLGIKKEVEAALRELGVMKRRKHELEVTWLCR